MIQLCGNDPDMTKIELQQHLQISLYPCLSERLKDDILKQLSLSVSTDMTLKCTPLSSRWEVLILAMHIHAPPAKSAQSQESSWAFACHTSIASNLHQILFGQ